MIRRPPRSTPLYSSAASDVYKRQKLYIVKNVANEYFKPYIAKNVANEYFKPYIVKNVANEYFKINSIAKS